MRTTKEPGEERRRRCRRRSRASLMFFNSCHSPGHHSARMCGLCIRPNIKILKRGVSSLVSRKKKEESIVLLVCEPYSTGPVVGPLICAVYTHQHAADDNRSSSPPASLLYAPLFSHSIVTRLRIMIIMPTFRLFKSFLWPPFNSRS